MASIEFPLSFVRQYTGPLDATTVFASLPELNDYIQNNPIAYTGQIVSVSAGNDAGVYTIYDGVLSGVKIATTDNINELDGITTSSIYTLSSAIDSTNSDVSTLSGEFLAEVAQTNAEVTALSGGIDGLNLHAVTTVGSTTTNSITAGSMTAQGNLNITGKIIGSSDDNTATGVNAGVIGGVYNKANGNCSFIGGGYSNKAYGINSAVPGGRYNSAAGCNSNVAGGRCNVSLCSHANVAGGYGNSSRGNHSGIGSGNCNSITGNCSTIAGGRYNAITDNFSSIVGGYNNAVNSSYSGIIGGNGNIISGTYDHSFIIGSNLAANAACTTFVNNLSSQGGLSATNLHADVIHTSLLEAASANITVIDITQHELSGFDVTGDTSINGDLSVTNTILSAGTDLLNVIATTTSNALTAESDTLDSVTTRGNITTNDMQVANLSATGNLYSGAALTDDIVVGGDTLLSIRGGLIYSATAVEVFANSSGESYVDADGNVYVFPA